MGIVHRLLAVSISADSTYAALGHKKAQYASRASVNLYTHIYFRGVARDEVGYILFIRQNAVQVLIPKYGLEGTLFLRSNSKKQEAGKGLDWVYDEEETSQRLGEVKLPLFMKLTVQVFLDSSDVQHEKLSLRLVTPVIPGFSVSPSPQIEENKSKAESEQKNTEKR